MKVTELEVYVLYQIARFANAPEILVLIATCRHFRSLFDSESIWKERNKSETFSPRQTRSSAKKLKTTHRATPCIVEAKRIYIAWWTCYIQQRRKIIATQFELDYEQALMVSLRTEAAASIIHSIETKVLSANDAQRKCKHGRILFNLSKRVVDQRQHPLPFVLHATCSSCDSQCMGSVRYCCCCDAYVCEVCYGQPGKAGHDRHPFTVLSHPERGCNFHSAYTCGCFDCGITVQLEVDTNTQRSVRNTAQCALVTVKLRCAGVDGLFRQKCRSVRGQQELLSRFRSSDDFLLEG